MRTRALFFALVLGLVACHTRELPPSVPDLIEPDLLLPDLAPGPPRNDCGGNQALAHEQGTSCGPCGFWVCDGVNADAVRCSDPGPLNACGACGPAPIEICNGVDDDCDGIVDPGCPHVIAVTTDNESRVRISGDRAAYESLTYVSTYNTTALDRVAALPSGTELLNVKNTGGSADISPDYFTAQGPLRAYDFASAAWITTIPQDYYVGSPVFDGQGGIVYLHLLDIGVWQVGSDTTTTLVKLAAQPYATEVSADGNWVAYVLKTSATAVDVYLFDRTAQTTINLSAALGDATHQHVAVDGHRVAWERVEQPAMGSLAPQTSVYVYDTTTMKTTRLPIDNAVAPRLSGDLMCFDIEQYYPAKGNGLFVHNFADDKTTQVLPFGTQCDIDGTRLAYTFSEYTTDAFYLDLLPGSL